MLPKHTISNKNDGSWNQLNKLIWNHSELKKFTQRAFFQFEEVLLS